MNIGDKVAFRIRRCNEFDAHRRDIHIRARGVITRKPNDHWIDVQWNDRTVSQIGWHPSSLILADQVHLEVLDERW
jgi:hypothetical protein